MDPTRPFNILKEYDKVDHECTFIIAVLGVSFKLLLLTLLIIYEVDSALVMATATSALISAILLFGFWCRIYSLYFLYMFANYIPIIFSYYRMISTDLARSLMLRSFSSTKHGLSFTYVLCTGVFVVLVFMQTYFAGTVYRGYLYLKNEIGMESSVGSGCSSPRNSIRAEMV